MLTVCFYFVFVQLKCVYVIKRLFLYNIFNGTVQYNHTLTYLTMESN